MSKPFEFVTMPDTSVLFNQPSAPHIADNGTFYVQRCLIAYDKTTAKVVYFVSDYSGREYGQFANRFDALKTYSELIGSDGSND